MKRRGLSSPRRSPVGVLPVYKNSSGLNPGRHVVGYVSVVRFRFSSVDEFTMKDESCLIVSQEADMNAHAMNWGVGLAGGSCCWLRSGSLADVALPSLAWSVSAARAVARHGCLANTEWKGILFRLHRSPEKPELGIKEDRDFVEREWETFQEGVFSMGAEAFDGLWINCPVAATRAESKLVQLQEARRCGLNVPDTLIGNDSEAVLEFLFTNASAVYKPFRSQAWSVDGRSRQTRAARLPKEAKFDPRALALCPGIYQALVEKRADWRVTVIGKRMFAARIQAHEDPIEIDWRPTLMSRGRDGCTLGELPQAVVTALQTFMTRLGLAYGAIDLVEDLDGEFWFLEVNPFGQFLFVEHLLPELPLLQSFCAMLLEGRLDYDLDHCKGVRLAEFRSSQAYAQFEAARAA